MHKEYSFCHNGYELLGMWKLTYLDIFYEKLTLLYEITHITTTVDI